MDNMGRTIFTSFWFWVVMMLLAILAWFIVPAMSYTGPDMVMYKNHSEARCAQEFYGNNVWIEKCHEEMWILGVGNPHWPVEVLVSQEVYDMTVVGSEYTAP